MFKMNHPLFSDSMLESLCKRYSNFLSSSNYYEQVRTNPTMGASLVEDIEKYLTDKRNGMRSDQELILMLALTELLTPLEDFQKSMEYCHEVLKLNENSVPAKLLFAFIDDYYKGGICEDTYNHLLKMETSNNRCNSAKHYFIAKYFKEIDFVEYSINIKRSIEYFQYNISAAMLINPNNMPREMTEYVRKYKENRRLKWLPQYILCFESFLNDRILGLVEYNLN